MSNLEQQATIKGAHIAELADQNKNYNLELNQVHCAVMLAAEWWCCNVLSLLPYSFCASFASQCALSTLSTVRSQWFY